MKEIVLNQEKIESIKVNDKIYAQKLKDTLEEISKIVRKTPSMLKVLKDLKSPEYAYIARMSREAFENLRNGNFSKMLKKDSGLWTGIIKKTGGKIVEQARFEQVSLQPQLMNSLSTAAVQLSIAELSEKISEIDRKMDYMNESIHQDRISKVKAGIDLYNDVLNIQDSNKRDLILVSALQTLTEGKRALMGELETVSKIKPKKPIFKIFEFISEHNYFGEINNKLPIIRDAIKWGNESILYIGRIHILRDCKEAAFLSVLKYAEDCEKIISLIKEKEGCLPHDILVMLPKLNELEYEARNVFSNSESVIIEIPAMEVINE